MVAEQLRAHILIHKQETEQAMQINQSFETLKPVHTGMLPPSRPHFLIPLKQLPTGYQVFKSLRLMGHMALKLSQRLIWHWW